MQYTFIQWLFSKINHYGSLVFILLLIIWQSLVNSIEYGTGEGWDNIWNIIFFIVSWILFGLILRENYELYKRYLNK
jgi:hypothetical protein